MKAIDDTYMCLDAVFGIETVDEAQALMAELFNSGKRSVAGIHIEGLLFDIPLRAYP